MYRFILSGETNAPYAEKSTRKTNAFREHRVYVLKQVAPLSFKWLNNLRKNQFSLVVHSKAIDCHPPHLSAPPPPLIQMFSGVASLHHRSKPLMTLSQFDA